MEHGGLRASVFRYEPSVAAVRVSNRKGEIILLPYQGQQIWRCRFFDRELTMKSMFEAPEPTQAYLRTYGGFFLHCGAISDIIPDLIGAGVDVIHLIQALAAGMDPQSLRARFGGMASFCGGVDAQYLLVDGDPPAVRDKVHELKALFPTGLIISPSHEAILPDTKPANIKALFEAVRA